MVRFVLKAAVPKTVKIMYPKRGVSNIVTCGVAAVDKVSEFRLI